TPTTQIYTLSLHDALPIFLGPLERLEQVGGELRMRLEQLVPDDDEVVDRPVAVPREIALGGGVRVGEQRHEARVPDVPDHRGERSEEHTSELQSQSNLVCR